MTDVVVVEAVRTPFGKRGGALADVHPAVLLGRVLAEAMQRSGIDPAVVGQVAGGCVEKTGEQGFNITRTAWVSAGLPVEVPAFTVDVQCGSSQLAFNQAHALVASGLADVAVACGVESMSRIPMGTTFSQGPGHPVPAQFLDRYPFPDQFASAEVIAKRWGITRQDCDSWAVTSSSRASAAAGDPRMTAQFATAAGLLADECVRPPDPDKIASLAPVSEGAVHTAATASKIADGAAAVVLASADRSRELGVRPRARVMDSALVGVSPQYMLTGPIPATRALLARNHLAISDVGVVEINEAFASVVLAWAAEVKADPDTVNPNGGALAHGHPVGATGSGLITKAVHELEQLDRELALVTMCCGGAVGTGTLLQRLR